MKNIKVLWLFCTLLFVACVPTSEPITIAGTRIPAATATGVQTLLNVDAPAAPPTATATKIIAPALLAQWNTGESRYELRPVDATTGQNIPGYRPLPLGGDMMFELQTALSADGRYLAATEASGEVCEPVGGGTACYARTHGLHLVQVNEWQSITATLPGTGWVGPLLFSPDQTRLALTYHSQAGNMVLLFDTADGNQLGQQPIPFRPALMTFSAGGSLLLAGAPEGENRGVTAPGPFTVLLLDGATLAEQWLQALPEIASGSWCVSECTGEHGRRRTEMWQPGIAATPDGRFLYIVHAGADNLTTVDLDERTINTVPIQAVQSWLERLLALTADSAAAKSLTDGAYKSVALSSDGRRLYVVGETWHVEPDSSAPPLQRQEFLGLQVVEAASGHLLATKETTAGRIRLTPDGAYLLLDGWEEDGRWFEVWDAATLQMITRLEKHHATVVPLLDGSYALLASATTGQQIYLSLMPPPRFKCAPVWTVDSPITWIAGSS